MNFEHVELENGLHVLAECNPHAHSAAVATFVDAGSRDEDDTNAGVSHFLEHMAFKGTERRSADDVNRELDETGSHSNARTSEEKTIYHAAVLPEFLEPITDLLCDLLRPSLREDDFETEKKVIVEEILMYDDQPPFGGHERLMAAYFGEHPLGRSVLGTVESVTALTPASMRAYFDRRYAPDNLIVAAAGKVDFDALVETVRRTTQDWAPSGARRSVEAARGRQGFEVMTRAQAAQEYILQLAAGPACESLDRYASRLLATIFGDDSGSRLFWELVDPGWVEFAGASSYEFEGSGVTMTVLCCAPESAQENLERLIDLQRRFQSEGVTPDELERAKRKVVSHVVRRAERPESRMFSLAHHWSIENRYVTTAEVAARYEEVTLDDIHRVLVDSPYTQHFTLAVGPLEAGELKA